MALSLAAALTACKKEDISIEKNDSVNWEIDKTISDQDIRTRIGYDPRYEYVLFGAADTEIPMLTLASQSISGQNTREVVVKTFAKPAEEDLQVTLAYDATLFDKIKGKYGDYKLGEASLVNITEATKTLAKGASTVTFTLTNENKSGFTEKFLLPFSIKVANEKVKLVDGYDFFVVKVLPKEVKIAPTETQIAKSAYLRNGVITLPNDDVTVIFESNVALPSGFKVKVTRDDAALPSGKTIAPTGIEGTISEETFDGKIQDVSFNLDKSKLPATLAKYVLPLKYVFYDKTGKIYETENNHVFVNIAVKKAELEDNPTNAQGSHNAPTGTQIAKSDITFEYASSSSTGRPERMLDGDYTTETTFFQGTNTYLYFTFSEEKLVKSVHFKMKKTHGMTQCYVFAAQNSVDDLKEQGWANFTEEGEDYTITFKEAIPVKYLVFSTFTSATRGSTAAWFEIYAADFYEE